MNFRTTDQYENEATFQNLEPVGTNRLAHKEQAHVQHSKAHNTKIPFTNILMTYVLQPKHGFRHLILCKNRSVYRDKLIRKRFLLSIIRVFEARRLVSKHSRLICRMIFRNNFQQFADTSLINLF